MQLSPRTQAVRLPIAAADFMPDFARAERMRRLAAHTNCLAMTGAVMRRGGSRIFDQAIVANAGAVLATTRAAWVPRAVSTNRVPFTLCEATP